MEEIYIDNILMDLDDSVNISLCLKSNIFSDISKITSNNSYTIKLPKTYNNRKAFGFADMPSNASDLFRKTRRVRYLRNGIEIIKDGEANLLGCNDKIEIALTWGYPAVFSSWLKDGKKLQDLPFPNEAIQWGGGDYKDSNVYKPYFFSRMSTNNGRDNTPHYAHTHPVITADTIISWVSETLGIPFLFSTSIKSSMKLLVVPLLTANATRINEVESDSRYDVISSPDSNVLGYVTESENLHYVRTWSNSMGTGATHTVGFMMDGKISYSLRINTNTPVFFVLRNTVTNIDEDVHKPNYSYTSGRFPYQYNTTSYFEINRKKDQVLMIKCEGTNLEFDLSQGAYHRVWFRVLPQQLSAHDTNRAAYSFPIVANLPDMTQLDFIKAICAILGLYVFTEGDTLRFVEVDVLYSNMIKAVNWSDRMVGNAHYPNETKFALNGFAQKNIFAYKEDKEPNINANGILRIDNDGIESNKTIITLPFSPCADVKNNSDTFAHIDLYVKDYEKEDSYFELQKTSPRILQEISIRGKSACIFSPLNFQRLLSENYFSYKKIIDNQRVITLNVRLSDIDLKKIDFAVPVYFEQYGGYFAIVEIKTGKGDAKVELIKL